MISRILTSKTNIFMRCLTYQPTRMITPIGVRNVHARGYNNFDDNYSFIFNEINFALMGARNTDNFVFVYKKYGQYMTDRQIMFGFHFIGMNKLERSPEFWNEIVPMVKKQITTLDRQTWKSLYMAVEGAAGMYLQDNEFWEAVERKFVDEELWRYFDLETTVRLLNCFARVGRGSDEIVELIEKHLIKHRKGLTQDTIEIAKQGFAKINKGSEILQRVLADPKTQLPALE